MLLGCFYESWESLEGDSRAPLKGFGVIRIAYVAVSVNWGSFLWVSMF